MNNYHAIEVERVRDGYSATVVTGFIAGCSRKGATIAQALATVGPTCCACGDLRVVLIGGDAAKRHYERIAHAGMVTPPPYRNLDTRIIPHEEQDRVARLYRERCAQ